jgi:hypothetical protein
MARLAGVACIPEARRYAGCVSWVELDADVEVGDARPVIDDAQLAGRLAVLRDALGDPIDAG